MIERLKRWWKRQTQFLNWEAAARLNPNDFHIDDVSEIMFISSKQAATLCAIAENRGEFEYLGFGRYRLSPRYAESERQKVKKGLLL